MRKLVVLVVALAGSTACNNACQAICADMANVAEDECGYTVPDDQMKTCVERQNEAEPEERQACREFGDEETILEEWGCDELADYFAGG